MTDDTKQILQAMALGFRDVSKRIDEVQEDLTVMKQDIRVLKDEAQHTNARLTRIEEKLELPPLQKKFG